MPAALAEVIRNEMVESVHYGHLVLLNAKGEIQLAVGDINLPIFPRSCVKPLQARAMVKAGLNLAPKLLALVTASHSGSETHIEIVRQILNSVGLDESALQCALDKPIGEVERKKWGDAPATRIAMNCSGKHAGMLATCIANKWPIKNYLAMDHPLQKLILNEIESVASEKSMNKTFDGCGAPLFAISTIGLARAIQDLTLADDSASTQIRNAMREYPELVSGVGRLTQRWMSVIPGLLMKEGAEGVQIASLADGRTLAFKISDGGFRPFSVITAAALAHFGVKAPDESISVFGGGAPVGSIRATF
ncbi:asparaginase [Actinomycetes bacterium]|nr:asparaginase [Actinomycetes bacterium]